MNYLYILYNLRTYDYPYFIYLILFLNANNSPNLSIINASLITKIYNNYIQVLNNKTMNDVWRNVKNSAKKL